MSVCVPILHVSGTVRRITFSSLPTELTAKEYLVSVLGDLIRQILDDKDLDLEIDPLFVTTPVFLSTQPSSHTHTHTRVPTGKWTR